MLEIQTKFLNQDKCVDIRNAKKKKERKKERKKKSDGLFEETSPS